MATHARPMATPARLKAMPAVLPQGLRTDGDDLLLDCMVQPGARTSEVGGWHGDRLRIRIQAPPVDGKANDALVRFVAELAGLPRRDVVLERGETDRRKTLRLRGLAALPHARWPATFVDGGADGLADRDAPAAG
jgi:uncharacterized protein (TIGR00251 family)